MSKRKESAFPGFPADTLRFFRELRAHNDTAWFEANRDRYLSSVLVPAEAFVEALGDRLREVVPGVAFDAGRRNGAGSVFRIRRDVRFTKDKSPYKTNLGMLFWVDQGRAKRLCPHFYVGIYPQGGLVHAGLRTMPSALVKRYRQAVADVERGAQLRRILARLSAAGRSTATESLNRVPKPYPAEHPNADLLRFRGVFAETDYIDESDVVSPGFVDTCLASCAQMAPLVEWLAGALQTDARR